MKKQKNTKKSIARRIWDCVCWPFKKIWSWVCAFWKWLCNINFIALLNLTLLVAIIVLFTTLIMDITNYDIHTTRYANAEQSQLINNNVSITNENGPKTEYTNNIQQPVKIYAKRKPCGVAIRQTAHQNNQLMGDVIIDSHDASVLLKQSTIIKGNLYLQNMRKYTLPCNVKIEGNLFLRDLNMLQFCGTFSVQGNIYVSPRSSFGPIPNTATIGGQVIL